MQVLVSLLILAFGFAVLVAPNGFIEQPVDEGTKRWAAGWIGLVIGYWLS